MGQIARLEEKITLPLPDSKEAFYDWARQLIGELSKIIGEETNQTVNLILDKQGDTDAVYIGGVPNDIGVYPNGTWRIKVNDDSELDRQKMVLGSWVTVLTDDV